MLVVMAILTASLSPALMRRARKAKLHRARQDVQVIRDAVLLALTEIKAPGFLQPECEDGLLPVEMLVSDGDIPEIGPNGAQLWARPVDYCVVDFMEYHLSVNAPGGDARNAYRGWRGSYLTAPINPDPWGNRYMVNTLFLWQGCNAEGGTGYRYDVVALSAGPDEEVDSQFTQDGFIPGDDDVICLISRGTLYDAPGSAHGHGPGRSNRDDDDDD
jgi:type II secretory pathway pseudopilin PulG